MLRGTGETGDVGVGQAMAVAVTVAVVEVVRHAGAVAALAAGEAAGGADARQITQRRAAALPVEVRQELLSRKREAETSRCILPDAPPRKRRARLPSPEREACVFDEPQPQPQASRIIIQENIQLVPPRQNEGIDIILELEAGGQGGAEDIQRIGINDKEFDVVIDEWIKLTDELSDCDMDIEDEESFFPQTTSRNASTEPSVLADLTPRETQVLDIEDRQNDLAIREFVSSDCYDFKWTRDRQMFTGRRENFTGTPGPTFEITDQTRIVDIFYKMIDIDFIDRICTETNRYADQKIKMLKDQNKFLPTIRLHRWIPTDRSEMISFLAIIILQGLYPLPEEESYFRFNGFGTMPYFSKIMSYNRFLLIKSLIHFVDNETITEHSRLCKIQPVTDYFNEKFSSMYYPSQDIVIDESLLKWHGRLGFAQKILSKAAQVGVKTYELCESSSGYLWKFFIYAGKDKTRTATATTTDDFNIDDTDDRPAETETTDQLLTGSSDARPSNATAKIVYDLVEPLLHRGHTSSTSAPDDGQYENDQNRFQRHLVSALTNHTITTTLSLE
uniref:PiggyBac transposable element-derived protein domain-containing protein n=1 Tax=Heliothis virescens TaxID=7102 RepID=A0A2A4J9R0_HELVI